MGRVYVDAQLVSSQMIVASAVWHKGHVYTGRRHNNAIHNAVVATGIKPVVGVQGFVNEKGEFLDRLVAAKHAIECGQVKVGDPDSGGRPFEGIKLYSENLWRGPGTEQENYDADHASNLNSAQAVA